MYTVHDHPDLCKLLPFFWHLLQDVWAAEYGLQVLPGGLAQQPVVQQVLQVTGANIQM
jgi:hypothetical protein